MYHEASATRLLEFGDNADDSYTNVQMACLDTPTVIAKEFKYHQTCYQSQCKQNDKYDKEKDLKDASQEICEKCFKELIEYNQEQIIKKGFFIRLQTLSDRYGQHQEKEGITVKGTIFRNLKDKLVRKFRDKISFFQKSNGSSEIMYGTEDCLSFNLNYNLNQSDIVCSCVKMIREELLRSKGDFTSWPPPKNELSTASSLDLPLTKLLLSLILTKTRFKINDRLTSLISQDLLYNVIKGKVRTKKHVQLGISIKRKTGSVAVLSWLNRFGHSITYDEVKTIKTKIAANQVKAENIRKYVPNNIQLSTFVTFIYSNCDHNMESIYNVTMHAMNGIII